RKGERCSRIAPTKPPIDVLFRPEEIHRASGEDDVLPPPSGGDQAVKQEALVVDLLATNLECDPLTAVRTRRLDAAIRVQSGTDADCIPRAVPIPPVTAG